MIFPSVNGIKRPVRLCDATRRFAAESLGHKYGLDTEKVMSVELDSDALSGLSDIEKYDLAIKTIAEKAPVRICENEKLSGAATLGLGIRHLVPATCGEYYAVSFAVKNCCSDWVRAGHSSGEKDLNKWLIPGHTVPLSAPDADGWRRGAVLMRVPDCGNSVEFTAGLHLAEGESAWLKDLRFLKVIPLLKDGFPAK